MLDKIMKPRSVALIGASTRAHTIGSDILKRLIEYGFTGPIYPVNPKGGEIEGLTVCPSDNDLPDNVDLAIIVINSAQVLDTIDQCHAKAWVALLSFPQALRKRGRKALSSNALWLKK